jgi:hypothetical protein
MGYTRFYTAVLMAVTVLNTGRYHLPYLEYDLFGDYIAENLCVKRNEANNCCRGKCFLEKQIDLVNETDSNAGDPVKKRHINPASDDYIKVNALPEAPNPFIKVQLSVFSEFRIPKITADIPVPPPKRFI